MIKMSTAKRKLLINTLTVSTLAIFSTSTFSNVSTTKFINTKSNKVETSLKSTNENKIASKLKGDFSFQSNEWVQDVGEVVGNKYFGEINIDYNSNDSGEMEKKFQMSARVNDKEQMMYSVPEAYLKYNFGDNDIVFGRAILPWNQIDSVWGFGKLNNRKNFDGFEPGLEGLTGITVSHKSENGFNFSLFGSMIYVPEMNPGMKIDKENKSIVCENPWCKAPAPSAEVDGRVVPIEYTVNYPEISDVVFRYSVGGRIGYENEDFSAHAFTMRKPENTLSVLAEVAYENGSQSIEAEVTPQFYYHDVMGLETKINLIENVQVYGSVFEINPEKTPDGNSPNILYTGIKPNKKKEQYMGGGLQYNNKGIFQFGFNYIARTSSFDITAEDQLVEYPRWNQAYHFNIKAQLSRKLSVGADYKYDMLTEDRLTMFSTNYAFSSDVSISVGANMIGSNENKDSYWSDFVNNDTVYSSMKYLF
jgi:hypothetical protein